MPTFFTAFLSIFIVQDLFSNMCSEQQRVIDKLGQAAWDILCGAVDVGTITAQHMQDIAYALHKHVGGKHKRRVNNPKIESDRAEFRRVLCDWWVIKLHEMKTSEALQMLIKVLRKSDICLFPIALELEKVRKRESDTTSLDTIIDSFEIIFENEVSIVKRLKSFQLLISRSVLFPLSPPCFHASEMADRFSSSP